MESLLRSLNYFFYSASILACYISHYINSNTRLNCKIFKICREKITITHTVEYTEQCHEGSHTTHTCLCKLLTVLRTDEKLVYLQISHRVFILIVFSRIWWRWTCCMSFGDYHTAAGSNMHNTD